MSNNVKKQNGRVSTIRQAVILSAGLGTRLRPLTDNIPKVMVPFSGKPLLQWHVEQLKKHGVSEFFINLHYLPDVIRDYFGDGSKFGVKINYFLEQPEILGTAGGIKDFSAEGGSPSAVRRGASGGEGKLRGDFFVIYGDVFSLLDYSKMAEAFYAKKDNPIGMTIVGFNDHPHDSDLAQVDENLKFIKVYPKPNKELPPNWRAMRTTFIFNERILKYIPANKYYEIDHQLLPDILPKGEIFYGYETDDFLKDIGTPERYAEVQKYLTEKGL